VALLQPFQGGIVQPLNNAGAPVPAGTLTFYATGGVTPKDVYHDAQQNTVWVNPVVLDAYGRALIFLLADGAYDVVFKDADGNTIWSIDAIASPTSAV
jgi:hypothetical protein